MFHLVYVFNQQCLHTHIITHANYALDTHTRTCSMVRPRNERKRVEREERARLLAEDKTKGNATDAGESDSGNDPATHTTATEEEPKHVNFNLFRRNMGEWLVEIAAFKKAYPAVYEEEYNTRIDAETALYIHRWREVLHTCIDTYTQKQHTSMQTHISTNTRNKLVCMPIRALSASL